MVVLGQVKVENSSLPVAVRVSKTRVLKLSNVKIACALKTKAQVICAHSKVTVGYNFGQVKTLSTFNFFD